MVYQQKPDICFIDTLTKLVILFELTVPFETNIDAAHQRKEDRYAGLTHDVEKAEWKCTLICVEIGSRGLITPQNKVRMKEMLKLCNSKIKYSHMREEILKTVLFGSYVIFNLMVNQNHPGKSISFLTYSFLFFFFFLHVFLILFTG